MSHTLFDSGEVGVGGDGVDDWRWNVLPGAGWDVVDDRGSHWEDGLEVGHHSFERGFTVVWVDVESCVHSNRKSLFGCVHRFSC